MVAVCSTPPPVPHADWLGIGRPLLVGLKRPIVCASTAQHDRPAAPTPLAERKTYTRTPQPRERGCIVPDYRLQVANSREHEPCRPQQMVSAVVASRSPFDLAHDNVLHHPHSLRSSHARPSELVDHPWGAAHTRRCRLHGGLPRLQTLSLSAPTRVPIENAVRKPNPQQKLVEHCPPHSASSQLACWNVLPTTAECEMVLCAGLNGLLVPQGAQRSSAHRLGGDR